MVVNAVFTVVLGVLEAWLTRIRAGDLVVIFGTWFVLLGVRLWLSKRLFRWERWIARITGFDPFGRLHPSSVKFSSPDRYSTAYLKEVEEQETTSLRAYGRIFATSVVSAPVYEEVGFRLLPLVFAVTVTGHPLTVLFVANVVWAHLHVVNGKTRHTLPHLIDGLLSVYLWVHGWGLIAISLHAWNNLVAVGIETWQKEHPRVYPRFFGPGEEHVVVVRSVSHLDSRGLRQAFTEDDRQLQVADVEPGDVCRVRVAANLGSLGYAYPLEWLERGTDQSSGE